MKKLLNCQEQEVLQDAEDRCDQLIKSKVEMESKVKGIKFRKVYQKKNYSERLLDLKL